MCVAALLPFITDWDMMGVGYAWITIVGFAAVAAGITAIVLHRRARWDHDLIAGTHDLIAEWTVPEALWRRVTGRQFEQQTLANAPHRVAVAPTRLLLGDEWHSWGAPGSRLTSARFVNEAGDDWLDVRYSYLSRAGVLTERVLLPVPVEARADAERVVALLVRQGQ